MLAAERQNEILKLVRKNGSVRTNELSQTFECAEETIRRDLDKLTSSGLLKRRHGGAIHVDERTDDLQHQLRKSQYVKEKMAIARTAAEFIQAKESILLDASTSALAMVDFLPKEYPLTVITTSLLVAQRVVKHENHQLILLGGTFDPVSFSFTGLLTELAIQRVKIDRFFFSSKAIDAQQGATEPTEDRTSLKQRMIELSTWNCALADHSKIQTKSQYVFATPEDIDLLITDIMPSDEVAKLFSDANIEMKISS